MISDHSQFQKNINKTIRDAKLFSKKVDEFIKKTDKYLYSSPPKINRGVIRELQRQDDIAVNKLKKDIEDQKYKNAKKKYENDLHDIMEKIIEMKKTNLV